MESRGLQILTLGKNLRDFNYFGAYIYKCWKGCEEPRFYYRIGKDLDKRVLIPLLFYLIS